MFQFLRLDEWENAFKNLFISYSLKQNDHKVNNMGFVLASSCVQ